MNNFNPTNDIKELLTICIEKIKQDPTMVVLAQELENLTPQLENIEVKKESVFVMSDPLAVKNEDGKKIIYLGKEQVADYQKHLLVELMPMAMKGDSIALNKGLSAIIINNMIGSEDLSLSDEEICTNLIAQTYDFDTVFDYAVKGQLELNIEDKTKFKNITNLMDHNYYFRKKAKKSHLGSIQKLIISGFIGKDDLNEEKVNNFEMNLCSEPNMFEESGCEYPGLETVGQLFQVLKKNINYEEIEKIK